ncbi:MAG: Gfo/Idh/MocA family oxidoreductase [Clostridiales Family XIII bacterium]|jgi:predicted dehydrogenase|nr:Gfo/Idh/MocA family oxidoreductase [Clostridiales Family XIII bacterium]
MKDVKWGIIGTGFIAAEFTMAALGSNIEIKAVASRNLKKVEDFVRTFGSGRYGTKRGQKLGRSSNDGGNFIEKAYGSYEKLFADKDINAIYIAIPRSDHYKWAIEALKQGKNLLIEKAFTENHSDAKKIIDLAEKKKLFVMEAMWTRFLPHIIEIKKIIKRGDIGEIIAIYASHAQFFPYDKRHRIFDLQKAGGALLELEVYPISFVHDILGYPKKVIAVGNKAKTGVDSNLSMLFEYKNAQALIHTASIGRSSTSAEIVGTKGRIEIDSQFYRPSSFTAYYNDGASLRYENKGEREDLFGMDGLYGMHFEILEATNLIQQGKIESKIMSHKATLDIMKIMDNIRKQINVKYPDEK